MTLINYHLTSSPAWQTYHFPLGRSPGVLGGTQSGGGGGEAPAQEEVATLLCQLSLRQPLLLHHPAGSLARVETREPVVDLRTPDYSEDSKQDLSLGGLAGKQACCQSRKQPAGRQSFRW